MLYPFGILCLFLYVWVMFYSQGLWDSERKNRTWTLYWRRSVWRRTSRRVPEPSKSFWLSEIKTDFWLFKCIRLVFTKLCNNLLQSVLKLFVHFKNLVPISSYSSHYTFLPSLWPLSGSHLFPFCLSGASQFPCWGHINGIIQYAYFFLFVAL